MNEAETRADLIDPALKAAGWGVVEASHVRREVITRGRLRGAGKPSRLRGPNAPPSSHIHGQAIIGYPTRNIPGLIQDVGDYRRRPGEPGEPIAMQLDPPKPISRQFRIGPWMCQPEMRIGHDPRQRRIICLNQPPCGIRPGGPMRRGLKIASDHAQILLPGGVRDQDAQRGSFSLRVRPGPGACFLERLEHTPCLVLRGSGIANTSLRKVAHACIQHVGQRPWSLPADLLVHALGHSWYLVSARYHVQGPVRNTWFARQSNQRPTSPASLATP
jgi:hypothetical protein